VKQVVQNYRNGRLKVLEVPGPIVEDGCVLVANRNSLISAGTERATLDVSRRNLAGKARARPDLVRKVVDQARSRGVVETMLMVRDRLDRDAALGYSCAGTIVAVGRNAGGFRVGQRVACVGQDVASHAEFVMVPRNLCVGVPEDVPLAAAAYVAVGAIALQGVRQAAPVLGDLVAVIGLGLVGQIVCQLLLANGCRVVAADLDRRKLAAAAGGGIEHAVAVEELADRCRCLSGGHGMDAVLVCASTPSVEPIRQAADVSRQRGRVVVVGDVGLTLPREPFYRKELDLRMSTSYGPGRYDDAYELDGQDYPYGYVRWTERRNMAAFIELLAARRIDVERLTTHRFDIADASSAYELLLSQAEPYLGILLDHPAASEPPATRLDLRAASPAAPGDLRLGLIGVGAHVGDMLLPHLRKRARVAAVCTRRGTSARKAVERLGAAYCTTDSRQLLDDVQLDAVLIGTRHDTHAALTLAALEAGRHVFVEKPLCLLPEELEQIEAAYDAAQLAGPCVLMVGFNRRHSPHTRAVCEFFSGRTEPLVMSYRINALPLPADHWLLDPMRGGGRIRGEVCHFLDFLQVVSGARLVAVQAAAVSGHPEGNDAQNLVIQASLTDGSVGTVVYASEGDRSLPKERFEAFGGGRAVVIDDFRTTTLHRNGRVRKVRTRGQDKGFACEIETFLDWVRKGEPQDDYFVSVCAATRAALAAAEQVSGAAVGEFD